MLALVRLCLKVRALREHAGGAGDGEYIRCRNVAARRGQEDLRSTGSEYQLSSSSFSMLYSVVAFD